MLALLWLVGCGSGSVTVGSDGEGPTPDGSEELPASDTEVSVGLVASDSRGFALEVSDGVGEIRIEGMRGARREESLLMEHPELGAYEADFRAIDADGITFFSAIAGDEWAEPSWAEDYWSGEGDWGNPETRAHDWTLLVAATGAIEPGDVPGFDSEVRVLSAMHGVFDVPGLLSTGLPFYAGADGSDDELAPPPPSGSYTHYAQQWTASRYWGTYDHSAMLAWAQSSTVCYAGVMRGNHGAYPGGSGMSTYCSGSWSGRSSTTIYLAPYTDNSYGSSAGGGCSTSYGLTSGKHVCNDDSHAEYYNVKNNSYSSQTICGDSSLNTYADSCSSI